MTDLNLIDEKIKKIEETFVSTVIALDHILERLEIIETAIIKLENKEKSCGCKLDDKI